MPIPGFHDIFGELVLLLLIAAVIGAVSLRFRQPLIIGFIAVGILFGQSGLGWIKSSDQIHIFAEMGLALLLFIVGLKLDLRTIRTLGPTALSIGIGQVLLTGVAGFALALLLGTKVLTALYIGAALTFSSTIIAIKLLSDKHETDSLHGRIALGILIVQDLVVIIVMLSLFAFGAQDGAHPTLHALGILLKGAGLIAAVMIATLYILPAILHFLARSTELLVLFAIAWALALAQFGDVLGFGKEIGAFLAGVSLASTAYREIIGAKLVSLRDFLLLFFFVELGTRFDIKALGSQWLLALALICFVLLIKPLLILCLTGIMGYRKRTGFMVSVSLAQISEFSLILMARGAAAGHLGSDAEGMITFVGLLTIGTSGYLIQHAQQVYERLVPFLRVFERRDPSREDAADQLTTKQTPADVILFGLGRYGSNIAAHLQTRGYNVLGVDFDPQIVRNWQGKHGRAVFGDAEDPDFAATLPLRGAKWVVSAVHDLQTTQSLIHAVRHAGYTGNMAFAVHNRAEGRIVLKHDSGLLLVPYEDAAEQAVDLLINRDAEIARETMDRVIEKITDHYIVCGYGRMGQQIVKDLHRQRVPFVVVEDNPEQLPRLKEENIPHIVGKSSSDTNLLRAGIMRACGLIAVAASDEENVFIVLTARGLNTGLNIIARSIREENEDKLRRAGADRVMSPYILGGRRMAAAVTQPGMLDFFDMLMQCDRDNCTEVSAIVVPPSLQAMGKTIRELNLWPEYSVTILAIQLQNGTTIANPTPDQLLNDAGRLIVMGTKEQIKAAELSCQQYATTEKHVPTGEPEHLEGGVG